MHGTPGTEGIRTQAVVLFRCKILFITKFVFFCCAKGVLRIYTNFFGLATERTHEPCVPTDRFVDCCFFTIGLKIAGSVFYIEMVLKMTYSVDILG